MAQLVGTCELFVEVIAGKDLIAADSNGLSDPYLELAPTMKGCKAKKTKVVDKTLNPLWGDKLSWAVAHWRLGDKVALHCWDKDKLGKDSLGTADVKVGNVCDGERHTLTLPLKGVDSGTVTLTLYMRYDLRLRECAGLGGGNSALTLTVVSAKNLIAADKNGLSDPYAIVHYGAEGKGKKKRKTGVVHKSLEPEWNAEFALELADGEEQMVIEVMDEDKLDHDDPLGQVSIDVRSLATGDDWSQTVPLSGTDKDGAPIKHGRVTLQAVVRLLHVIELGPPGTGGGGGGSARADLGLGAGGGGGGGGHGAAGDMVSAAQKNVEELKQVHKDLCG